MIDKKRDKVFVFGIDGATFRLMNGWIAEGYLPNIESIFTNGTAAVCNSTIPPFSCPAWKSFATGMNPGKLGLFDLVNKEPGTYNIQPSRADMVEVPDIWELLTAEGYKVGVFNVPGTYPPRPVDGFVIAGMLGDYDAPDFIYPPELRSEIEPLFDPPYLIEADLTKCSSADEWLEEQRGITDMKVNIVKHLLTHKEWDFFVAVLYEVDRVQHALWHLMDPDHPRYTPSHLKHAIRDSYRRMDRILGEMLDLLPEDLTVIIMSDHGFGPIKGFFRLNQWLLSQKYLTLDEDSKRKFFENVAMRFLKKEQSQEPSQEEPPLNTIGGMYQINWATTRAFAVRLGNLYLNVSGREPEGIVEMGKEYEEVRSKLIQDLSKLVHPLTKEPLHVTIHKKEEVYSGPHFYEAPDLLVSIEEYSYLIEQGFGPLWGGLDSEEKYSTGGHTMDGIFIASGRDIKSSTWIDPVSLIDIAPTILHLMNVPIPSDIDGRVLSSLFKDGSDSASREVITS